MTEVLWKNFASLATTLHVMAVVVVLLMFAIYRNYEALVVIQEEHQSMLVGEGFSGGYTSRIGGMVQSQPGFDGSSGFGSVGSSDPSRSGFLGAYGPPVFYDIGDPRAQRDNRSSNIGTKSTTDQYKIDYTQKYASGRPKFGARTDASGKVFYVSLPDNANEGMSSDSMQSDESLYAKAQGFRAY
jgi:hypothetical protein